MTDSKWRSVKEQPKDDEIKLVYTVSCEYRLGFFNQHAGRWNLEGMEYFEFACPVTHWMPLPQSPEVEE